MARKYARDKNGRFASVGATARGGRLGGGKSLMVSKKRTSDGGLVPTASAPKGTVSGTRKGRVMQRAERFRSQDSRMGGVRSLYKAEASLSAAKGNKKRAATRNAKAAEARKAQFSGKSAKNMAVRNAYKKAASGARFERAAAAAGGGSKATIRKADRALAQVVASRGAAPARRSRKKK